MINLKQWWSQGKKTADNGGAERLSTKLLQPSQREGNRILRIPTTFQIQPGKEQTTDIFLPPLTRREVETAAEKK